MTGKRKFTRSSSIRPPDVVFPYVERFSAQLPTYKDVIGMMRWLMEDLKSNIPENEAVERTANMVYEKYKHDTVYCKSLARIRQKVGRDWEAFRDGKKRVRDGRSTGKEIERYNKLVLNAEKLFDVAAETTTQKDTCKAEWDGVVMGEREYEYLKDQRTDRIQDGSNEPDPVWEASQNRKMREDEREESWKTMKKQQFAETEVVVDDLEKENDPSEDEGRKSDTDFTMVDDESQVSGSRKRKMFASLEPEEEEDPLPPAMKHVRTGERYVRDDIYECLADLQGKGLSVNESMEALVRVAELFGRKWKLLGEEEDSFDIDTLPHERNVRSATRQIEVKGMSCMVDALRDAKQDGRMLTHATDSTTKKGIGSFAASGIHIGKNVPFPLPLIPICGEATTDIADQCSLMFEILAVVDGMTPESLYDELIDAHMTDSTEHNKGFAVILQQMFDLDSPKGQLFCGTHTTLGFSRAMNNVLAAVERDMTLEAIFNNFMIDLDFDSKHGSVGGQACDVILRLVAPEFLHKAWNYHDAFKDYLKKNFADLVLFDYKDQRFGCLSRACAVILYIKDYLIEWLAVNSGITNRLACLVRDFLKIPYLDVAFTVFAAFGIQLIEPFFSRTISVNATHSSLKVFYKGLYDRMKDPVDESFFAFEGQPWFPGVSLNLRNGVKETYNPKVVDSVVDAANRNLDECVTLANLVMPEIQKVLGRQRRDYNLSDDFEAEFPVEDQVANPDDTPVHNLGMERVCGKVDYRQRKLKQLDAVSRSMILDATGTLRRESSESFRSFRKKAEEIAELKMKWSKKMEERFAGKLNQKQVDAVNSDETRLELLEKLKEAGGPFTMAEQVEQYLSESSQIIAAEENPKKKEKLRKAAQNRMKAEVQYARESSTSLPKVDPLFRIMVSIPGKKRRDKTADEFGVALKALYGKRAGKSTVSLDRFKQSMRNISSTEQSQ